jgi:hypothetical protein
MKESASIPPKSGKAMLNMTKAWKMEVAEVSVKCRAEVR